MSKTENEKKENREEEDNIQRIVIIPKKEALNRNPKSVMINIKINNGSKAIALMTILLLFNSCSKRYFFKSEVEIPDGVWSSKKAAIFEPVLKDTTQNYNVIFSVSNTDDYRYSNIWFFVKTTSPDGNYQKDTLEYFLAEETGKWLGDKIDDSWTRKLYFKTQIRFPTEGKYQIEVLQGMRDVDLKGINRVGILFEEINQN